jgi:hypothetical protein
VSTGNYVSNRASDKITELCGNVYLLRSGSASDTQAVADYGNCKAPLPVSFAASDTSSHSAALREPARI